MKSLHFISYYLTKQVPYFGPFRDGNSNSNGSCSEIKNSLSNMMGVKSAFLGLRLGKLEGMKKLPLSEQLLPLGREETPLHHPQEQN